ncbi:anti sigma factor C-terminal domain-containing protein [Clostridium paraputrificum]|nr:MULTISPECIES: anti sigma factor C-terminal domain-containing protein [Clostridium]MDB2087785.1 anti sigma factor C-terminal domain-containing protein [Clostridium paraputrificum]MDU1178194.1 anti sigma factor C-terminal domain-containing protein [Clostridium sp.]MDU1225393.1 anti sigma factor C-terminal domain-containing protein [Clostridium sp.]MDU4317751.1 anti sigma factor C-terminal domain-containing protein [Clostridium sp.]MDU7651275.1 anti sigma factor C-terminal domain-containing pr
MKKYDKVGFFYAPVKISEVGYQGYTGITLGRSGYGMTNFYDKEKYPYLDLLQYDGVDIPPEIYEEHFMTLLNYMNDQKKFNKVIRSYFDYESIISYVEQYGIYSYGVVVKGTVEEVKKLMEDENYDDIFVLDTWLTSYTN